MSADRWTICPLCAKNERDRAAAAFAKAMESYGKVSVEEFEALKINATERPCKESMREDWEIGMRDGGRFSLDYGCYCEECKFQWTFRHEEIVTPPTRQEGR